MSEAGDIEGIARRLADIPPADQLPGLVPLHVAAAIELRDPDALAASAAAAIAAPLAPRMRALMAWRFAVAGHAAEAWAVLHSDPAILPSEDARGAVLQLLGRIGGEASARADLRLAARTLATRLARTPAEVETHPAPFAYAPGDAQPRPGGAPPEIVAAPGLRPHVLAAFVKQAETFEGMIEARRRPLEVRAHDDVFINRFGQVWRSEGGLLGHLLRGVEQPLPAASLDAMSTAPAVEEAVFAVEQFNNMFHWVADALPSIAWRFAPGVPPIPLAMQPDAAPYKAETLAALAGGEPPPILPAGDALFVRRLYFGPFGAHTIAPLGAHRDLIASIAGAADASPAPADGLPPLLYISRRDAAKRALGNEAALEEALAARGFGVRLFSGRGFLEQVRLIRGARVIVAPHGAALGLLLFAHAGTAVFEVMPGMAQAAGLRFCMARLSRLLALRHRIWLEPINALTGAWAASLDPLLADLDAWIR